LRLGQWFNTGRSHRGRRYGAARIEIDERDGSNDYGNDTDESGDAILHDYLG